MWEYEEDKKCEVCGINEAAYFTVFGFLCKDCLNIMKLAYERNKDAQIEFIGRMLDLKEKDKESFESLLGVRKARSTTDKRLENEKQTKSAKSTKDETGKNISESE